jgi:hypothetical protein
MKTRFILAFPTPGNSFQHYVMYYCDLELNRITRVKTTHDNRRVVSERYDPLCDERQVFVNRATNDNRNGRFIKNGKIQHQWWRTGPYVDTDIRFQPVVADFFSDRIIQKHEWRKYDGIIDRLKWLIGTCTNDVSKFFDEDEFEAKDPFSLFHLTVELNKLIDEMSLSQVVYSLGSGPCNSRGFLIPRRKSLKSIKDYLLNRADGTGSSLATDEFRSEIEKLYPEKLKYKSGIQKCLERRIRRFPEASKGTVLLLKMLVASRGIASFSKKINQIHLTHV